MGPRQNEDRTQRDHHFAQARFGFAVPNTPILYLGESASRSPLGREALKSFILQFAVLPGTLCLRYDNVKVRFEDVVL